MKEFLEFFFRIRRALALQKAGVQEHGQIGLELLLIGRQHSPKPAYTVNLLSSESQRVAVMGVDALFAKAWDAVVHQSASEFQRAFVPERIRRHQDLVYIQEQPNLQSVRNGLSQRHDGYQIRLFHY